LDEDADAGADARSPVAEVPKAIIAAIAVAVATAFYDDERREQVADRHSRTPSCRPATKII
jgi:hypothetical protein